MTDKEKISDLLSVQPLYKKVIVETEFFKHPIDIEGLSFSFLCPTDNCQQTFKLSLEPEKFIRIHRDKAHPQQFSNLFETFNESNSKYKFTQHYSATCQYCNEFRVDFLLQIETNKKTPVSNGGEVTDKPMQVIKKIGQFPPFQITPDKDLASFLSKEDQDNYGKALICRSQDYGIGAFAYLRRIVENELIRIVVDLSKIDRPESSKINSLIESYKENHIMTNLIEGVYEYLPSSLKNLGDNPLKVLYGQLSGGIHEFSEEECSEKASKIDTLLKFVVKKINEESSEVMSARAAMKNLKK